MEFFRKCILTDDMFLFIWEPEREKLPFERATLIGCLWYIPYFVPWESIPQHFGARDDFPTNWLTLSEQWRIIFNWKNIHQILHETLKNNFLSVRATIILGSQTFLDHTLRGGFRRLKVMSICILNNIMTPGHFDANGCLKGPYPQ